MSLIIAERYFLFVGVKEGEFGCRLTDPDAVGAHINFLECKSKDFKTSGRGDWDFHVQENPSKRETIRIPRGFRWPLQVWRY